MIIFNIKELIEQAEYYKNKEEAYFRKFLSLVENKNHNYYYDKTFMNKYPKDNHPPTETNTIQTGQSMLIKVKIYTII